MTGRLHTCFCTCLSHSVKSPTLILYAITSSACSLQDICALQHGPWDVSDGGADATSYAQVCLNNWLVTQAQQPVQWDVILFNFGLHNLDNSSAAEQLYSQQLTNITQRLVATKAKLLYATTTPFMPDHTVVRRW